MIARFARRQALGLLASTSFLAAAPAVAAKKGGPLYKDATAPIDLRIRDLLGRMTLEEKVGQIIALWATKADIMDDLTFSPAKAS
ncbi:MAG: beta-glucosidase, partial [Sphingomonadaceae bacterium]|nr:beta-glucosidase [Sphingomonadaceae bacterium]